MKKMFLFAAAVAALTLVSCAKSHVNRPESEGETSITLKIAGAHSSTRAIETPATNPTKPALDPAGDHFVFVINAGTILYLERLVPADAVTGPGQVIGATADGGSQKYFPTTSSVFVLGNIPPDITISNFGVGKSYSSLETAVSEISYVYLRNTDFTKPAMANENGPANVIPTGANTASVQINIKPLYSRIELKDVKGGSHIKSFDVSGVYLNNYNTKFKMNGTGDVTSLYATTATPPYASGWFGDYTSSISSVAKVVAPGTGSKVWAYNVAPGSVPTFVVELKNIIRFLDDGSGNPTATENIVAGPKYVTVTGYTGMSDATFLRGKIYQVGTVNFNYNDLTDVPFPTGTAITVEVDIVNWDFLPLTPTIK